MSIKKVTLWHNVAGDKYIITLSEPDRQVNTLKNYPLAYKVKRSYKTEMNAEKEQWLRKNFDEVIYL